MAVVRSPELFDPYLGKVYGNVLDMYDNPTYNLRLYLKPPSGVQEAPTSSTTAETSGSESTSANESADQRQDQGVAEIVVTASSKKVVVLAQTGVTGIQIDDLTIDGFNADASFSNKAIFTLVQPGAATFLDQLQYARKYLGETDEQLSSPTFDLYLDIKFLGYDHDPDDNEGGGEPTQIGETVTYKLTVVQIGVKVDNTGSRYNFECTLADSSGFNDAIYKFPTAFNIQGSTISEFFKSLETAYNDYLQENDTEFERPDIVRFNMSGLIGGPTNTNPSGDIEPIYITDETIPTQADDPSKSGATAPRFDTAVGTNYPESLENSANTVSGTAPEPEKNKEKIAMLEGETIYKAVGKILQNNKEFQKLVSRQEDTNDPANRNVNDQQTFVHWYDIHCEVKNLEWDKNRNQYTKQYTYTPYIIRDARSDIALTTKEFDFLKEKGGVSGDRPVTAIATKRLQDLYNANALHKSYFYTFTGLNDQIIDLDISIDTGISLLMPPKGGIIGDFALTKGPSLSRSEPENKDMTLGDQLEAAKKEKNKESLIGLFQKVRGMADSINNLSKALGRSVDEIKGAISDTTGATALRLANSINGADLDRLIQRSGSSESGDPVAVPSVAAEINVLNNGDYAPEVSGFLYAADLITPSNGVTSDERKAAGLLEIEANAPTSLGHARITSLTVPSPLSGVSVDGPAGILMGYTYRSRETTSFMQMIDLTLRGDPYYVTNRNQSVFETGKTVANTADQTVLPVMQKLYFLLTIGSPSRFDFIIEDEDANTGYWSDGRISGMMSGLYFPKSWKNKFSNGIFTTEIEANKEIGVPLQWIRPVRPGETPPNWDDLGAGGSAISDYVNDINRASNPPGAGGDQSETYEPGSQTSRVNVAAPPVAGETARFTDNERTNLANAGLTVGGGPNGTVTEEEIRKLGSFTSVPRPTGDKRADAIAARDWAVANGFRIDENAILKELYGSDWNPDDHEGRGHAQNRAFDLNIGGGLVEANGKYSGYRMDQAAKALEAAGYNVTWRSADHYNHIHFEVPGGN